ncbi:MAG: hypothetical protein AB1736_15630 [Chloroflexota bacterium]
MLTISNPADDRIRDLHAVAAGLRTERLLAARKQFEAGPATSLRIRLGRALMAAGAALVNGASPASPSRASR